MNNLELLRKALNCGSVETLPDKPSIEDYNTLDYAIWRFLHAWLESGELTSDHIVLLRQIVRWHGIGNFFVGNLPENLRTQIEKAGLKISHTGDLSAQPFAPEWLWGNFVNAESNLDGKPQKRRLDEEISAESYLKLLNYDKWQSQAQKEASWLSLNAPLGSTTLIALPTGSGKSLCFQLLSRFSKGGLTVVVVPTIALAIDQWQSAKQRLKNIPDINPLYFASDDSAISPETVVREIVERRTRLIFTSPEACVSGRLKIALENAAREGFFENFVVDEAHIIESWGAFFRVDFQMLSMVRERWLKLSNNLLRTFLLSATFTPQSRTTLRNLFGTGGDWLEFVCQRLRPEMTYFTRQFQSDNERLEALHQCAWQLPRPAIFYTTEVQKAKDLAKFLRQEGFERIGCFHGETPPTERRELLRKWREDSLDLMVATSAFGLGVDKSDVRTIIHACLPENLHRFYQEVGRGGRDGNSAICILIPTFKDIKVATNLAPDLLKPETLQKRWEAMWQTAENVKPDENVWKIKLNTRRTELLGQPTGDENVRWNKRLLLQLLRANKVKPLEINYVPAKDDSPAAEWATLKINFPAANGNIGENIAQERNDELEASREGLEQMKICLNGQAAICLILRRLYNIDKRVCGGCLACRRNERDFSDCPPLDYEVPMETQPKRKIVANFPNPFGDKHRASFKKRLREIVKLTEIRRFACEEKYFVPLLDVFHEIFRQNDSQLYRLDVLSSSENFYLSPDEPLAIFHIERLNTNALDFSKGKELWHLFASEFEFRDAAGKYPGESDGWQFYDDPKRWI